VFIGQASACRAGKHLLANNLYVHIRNIILHQISAKISVFFRSKAEEKALTAVSEKASRCDTHLCSHKLISVTFINPLSSAMLDLDNEVI